MMGWREFRERMAARAYARKLPAALRRGYGKGGPYTRPQIDASIQRLNLSPAHAYLAYGLFLSQTEFQVATEGLRTPGYDTVRSLLRSYLPPSPVAPWNPDLIGHGSAGGDGGPGISLDCVVGGDCGGD